MADRSKLDTNLCLVQGSSACSAMYLRILAVCSNTLRLLAPPSVSRISALRLKSHTCAQHNHTHHACHSTSVYVWLGLLEFTHQPIVRNAR